MRFSCGIFFFCLLFNAHCWGQFLWKITSPAHPQPSYLFGTIHVDDERIRKFADMAMEKISEVDVFAQENIRTDSTYELLLQKYLFMPGDTTLADFFPVDKTCMIRRELARKLGSVSHYAERMRPFFIHLLLAEQAGIKTSNNVSLENYLMQKALSAKKQLVGLQTIDQQFAFVFKIPLHEQAQVLWEELNRIPSEEENNMLVQLYLNHDLEGLYQKIVEHLPEVYANYLLGERNRQMTLAIRKLIAQRQTFVAIGAAHLGGKQGIIQHLKNAGYRLEALD